MWSGSVENPSGKHAGLEMKLPGPLKPLSMIEQLNLCHEDEQNLRDMIDLLMKFLLYHLNSDRQT
jgi:hypothetical protein